MPKKKQISKGWIAAGVLLIGAFAAAVYWFQYATIDVGGYTVVYYKNRCEINTQSLAADLESLKALPCLIRINWRERIASDMEQEYCYLPDRGVEKSRIIHTGGRK